MKKLLLLLPIVIIVLLSSSWSLPAPKSEKKIVELNQCYNSAAERDAAVTAFKMAHQSAIYDIDETFETGCCNGPVLQCAHIRGRELTVIVPAISEGEQPTVPLRKPAGWLKDYPMGN